MLADISLDTILMNHTLYNYISSIVIFSIWLYLAIRGIKEYFRLMKSQGSKYFITRSETHRDSDLEKMDPTKRWKRATRRLFLIWVITAIVFLIISMIIGNTIGFKES